MAFCPRCNAEIGKTVTRCPSCGYDWNDLRAADASAARKERRIALVGTVVLGIVLAIGLLYLMVNSPRLSLPIVANGVFCMLMWSMLIVLVRRGRARLTAASFLLGAILYLLVVRFFIPEENEFMAEDTGLNGIMITTKLLDWMMRVAHDGTTWSRSEHYAFMWSGQAIWSILVGVASALTARWLADRGASRPE